MWVVNRPQKWRLANFVWSFERPLHHLLKICCQIESLRFSLVTLDLEGNKPSNFFKMFFWGSNLTYQCSSSYIDFFGNGKRKPASFSCVYLDVRSLFYGSVSNSTRKLAMWWAHFDFWVITYVGFHGLQISTSCFDCGQQRQKMDEQKHGGRGQAEHLESNLIWGQQFFSKRTTAHICHRTSNDRFWYT